MEYPFLPVNPCCTDVVLNSPCGCSSTLPNTSCGQSQCGTNIILSSNVLYDGPVLDCIIAEPCDTLNVILQKIDEIICNLLNQINILNIQVENISNQVIQINNSITNINNTLDVCCNVTTTTTSTSSSTTTTTTTAAPINCLTYKLATTGPSVSPGDSNWSAIECDTELPVGGTITYPNSIQTGCIIDSSLVLGIKVVELQSGPCETTTTTTTAI
jgi:hypothetical protein